MLHEEAARNPLSRRTGEAICSDCGKAEALADLCMPNANGSADEMFRVVIYSDRCEGRRLPPGIPWGPSMTLTTGSVIGHDDPYDDKCPECGSLFVYGYSCTECHAVRPALEQLQHHPLAIEQEEHRQREEALERAYQEAIKLSQEAVDYIGSARRALCVNCNEQELQHRDDYICVRCRASDELKGNPVLQHVLTKLDARRSNW